MNVLAAHVCALAMHCFLAAAALVATTVVVKQHEAQDMDVLRQEA
jgi:hypothetical protein